MDLAAQPFSEEPARSARHFQRNALPSSGGRGYARRNPRKRCRKPVLLGWGSGCRLRAFGPGIAERRLDDANGANRIEADCPVDALDQLRHGVLHIEDRSRAHIQMQRALCPSTAACSASAASRYARRPCMPGEFGPGEFRPVCDEIVQKNGLTLQRSFRGRRQIGPNRHGAAGDGGARNCVGDLVGSAKRRHAGMDCPIRLIFTTAAMGGRADFANVDAE